MIKVRIADIQAKAPQRPQGYVEAVLASGNVQGEYLIIDFAKYRQLVEQYNPQVKKRMKGFGDMVAKAAQPIAKAIDKVAGTNIQNCQPCKKRQETLNQVLPFK